eukprot:TRINITY_DN227_c0_g1_i1.p1 TRINITY_DN227_c0_g1~~TRINITY_DN227_c0_g1_i1.p1  ORF type:complete len:199 (+),score=15.65 TRINITY_DN227_c0_g1_i1:316-912(+)
MTLTRTLLHWSAFGVISAFQVVPAIVDNTTFRRSQKDYHADRKHGENERGNDAQHDTDTQYSLWFKNLKTAVVLSLLAYLASEHVSWTYFKGHSVLSVLFFRLGNALEKRHQYSLAYTFFKWSCFWDGMWLRKNNMERVLMKLAKLARVLNLHHEARGYTATVARISYDRRKVWVQKRMTTLTSSMRELRRGPNERIQ